MVAIKKKLNSLIHISYLVVFCIFAFFAVFHFKKYYILFEPSTLKTISFMLVSALLLVCLNRIRQKMSKHTADIVRIVMVLLLLSGQVLLFLKVITPLGWDVQEIVNPAIYGMYNGDYFVKYPNNLFLELLLSAYLKLTSFISFLSEIRKLEILNLFFVDIAIWFLWMAVKKVYEVEVADRALLVAVFLIGFHPMLSVIYSDTMAMPFPIGMLCCLIYGMKADNGRKSVIYYGMSGILFVVGYFIKPTTVIMGIAIGIMLLINHAGNETKKRFLVPIFAAVFMGGLIYGGITMIEKPVKEQLQAEYPDLRSRDMLHYINLGLSVPGDNHAGYGSWEEGEVLWMQQHIGHTNYKEEMLEHIKDRLSDFGVGGYLEHLMNKLIWMGSDGTFFYGGEGGFHLEEKSADDTVRGRLQNAFYTETDFYQNWYGSWMQGIWFLICLMSIICFWYNRENEYNGMAKLAVLGLVLFLLIFENRSRYLFLYLPVMLFAIAGKKKDVKSV